MEVYRLSRKKYADQLSGKGASITGGRWNTAGTEIIYVATNRSLAMAEVVVSLSIGTLPDDYLMLSIFVPDSTSMLHLNQEKLPADWNAFPHAGGTKRIGDEFIRKNEACLLRVPSAVTKGDFNLLLNPFHPEFQQIRIIAMEPFPFDHRLFKAD
jgi:RES domain-containing protein